jgi:hypothetical protein
MEAGLMTLQDKRWWLENTPAGALHRALGSDPFYVDHDAVDAHVEEVRKHHSRTYGRELSDGELAAVRVGAELRSSPAQAMREVPRSTAEIVDLVNRSVVDAGWSYTPEFRGQHSGMAMRQPDGTWTGDPAIVAATAAAEEAKRLRAERDYEAWRTGPVVIRTIAPPS